MHIHTNDALFMLTDDHTQECWVYVPKYSEFPGFGHFAIHVNDRVTRLASTYDAYRDTLKFSSRPVVHCGD